ncbi:unnamed protein product [Schistocephalus solidus]|uniref:Ras-GEF domain-containing protein n=1 Tax=Schistocephalus solidus TaxID=70667 RepID=A0A183SN60_SCHSO|nr:unnamed protein product [Schistocephalus solidus]
MQDTWMARKFEEIQEHAHRNEMKHFFKAIKAINCSCIKETTPPLRSDGATLLTCGVMQRYVLTPNICSLMASAMLMDVYIYEYPGTQPTGLTDTSTIAGACRSERLYLQL